MIEKIRKNKIFDKIFSKASNKVRRKPSHKSAFSLIEISIVLLIIAIIVSGMLTVSTVAVTNAKIQLTKDRMDQIYKALGQYMLRSYSLPCPASITVTKNTTGYGASVTGAGSCILTGGVFDAATMSGTTAVVYGMVPVATLGLTDEFAEDGFGSKFAYIVYKNFTQPEYPTLTNLGGFSYAAESTTASPAIIAMPAATINSTQAFVLISAGPNKYGAFNADSTIQNSSSGASTYELKNMLSNISGHSADYGIVAANPNVATFAISESDSAVFDDIVMAKTRYAMIANFDAMFLTVCRSFTGYTDAFYGKIAYRTSTCTAPNDYIIPSAKCSNFGNWVIKQTCP